MLAANEKEWARAPITGNRQSRMNSSVDSIKVHMRGYSGKAGEKPFSQPYWWSAFQCVGAGLNFVDPEVLTRT